MTLEEIALVVKHLRIQSERLDLLAEEFYGQKYGGKQSRGLSHEAVTLERLAEEIENHASEQKQQQQQQQQRKRPGKGGQGPKP